MLENGGEFVDVVVGEGDGLGARVVPAMDAVVKVFCVHMEPKFHCHGSERDSTAQVAVALSSLGGESSQLLTLLSISLR